MSGQMYGADVAELERLASEFRRTAEELNNEGSVLTGILNRVAWLGDIATNYVGDWTGVQIPKIGLSTQFLNDAADNLLRQAEEQRQASESGGQPTRGTPKNTGTPNKKPPERDSATEERLRTLLLNLGIDAAVLGPLFEALLMSKAGPMTIEALEQGSQEISALLGAVKVMEKVGNLTAAVDAAVAFFDDYAEYSSLPTDERVLHAAVNAAASLATTIGVEMAVTAAVSAAATAIGATGVGFFVGKALGGLISAGVNALLEYGDEKFDVVDSLIADPVVEGWREVKKDAQLVGEVYNTVSDYAVEHLEDLGEAGQDLMDGARETYNNVGKKKEEMWNAVNGWLK